MVYRRNPGRHKFFGAYMYLKGFSRCSIRRIWCPEGQQDVSFAGKGTKRSGIGRRYFEKIRSRRLAPSSGVDGINTPLNSRRIQINLQTLSQPRKISAYEFPPASSPSSLMSTGIYLFMQRCRTHRRRSSSAATQFQYKLGADVTRQSWAWVRAPWTSSGAPELRDVGERQRILGLGRVLTIDRDPPRIAPGNSLRRHTLYDALLPASRLHRGGRFLHAI